MMCDELHHTFAIYIWRAIVRLSSLGARQLLYTAKNSRMNVVFNEISMFHFTCVCVDCLTTISLYLTRFNVNYTPRPIESIFPAPSQIVGLYKYLTGAHTYSKRR